MNNIHVQNLCRNYFTVERGNNKDWVKIAREYWAPFLRKELDELYPGEIPVLITTEFILRAVINDKTKKTPASSIYKELKIISKEVRSRGPAAAEQKNCRLSVGRYSMCGKLKNGYLVPTGR